MLLATHTSTLQALLASQHIEKPASMHSEYSTESCWRPHKLM